jgi:release factor glutamine methyltransferase
MNAELLLMFTLGCDRAYLYGHPERELTLEEQSRYQDALAQRAKGIPAQYITGHQEFWGMDLIVSPAVLIPRPETEHVIEKTLELCNFHVGPGALTRAGEPRSPATAAHSAAGRVRAPIRLPLSARSLRAGSAPTRATEFQSSVSPIKLVDVGTGSGCIALALAKELSEAEIHATDISRAALGVARANASRHQLADRIHFHETDLLAGIEKSAFDFVVSNPPYVGESEEDSVQLDVRKFEPRNAVFAGPIGTEVIERLIPQAHEVLKPGGWLVMEISGTIAERVRELLVGWKNVQITNDLQGIARVASAQRR